MTHRRAIALMVLVTLLWSMAGIVTRQLEAARSFEVTFWRSASTVLALLIGLTVQGQGGLLTRLRQGGWPLWLSGICWAVMFTAFMVALTLTSVAKVLVTMAMGPMATALFSRLFLGHHLPTRTWGAISVAALGIVWMFGGSEASTAGDWRGALVASAVPLAGALNLTLLQRMGARGSAAPDMTPSLLIGAVLSALFTLPLAWPLQASGNDVAWLALLGFAQLALPCFLMLKVSRVLPAPEVALLALLEVVFGVLWAWLGAGEQPGSRVLLGGTLVLLALAGNELLAFRRSTPGGYLR